MNIVKQIPGIDFKNTQVVLNNQFVPGQNQMSDQQSSLFLTETSNIHNNMGGQRLLVPAAMNTTQGSPNQRL